MTIRIGARLATLALAMLTGCVAAQPATPEPTIDFDVPPLWEVTEPFETDLSFADGATLAGVRIEFHNGLGSVYDWEIIGVPTETFLELENANAGCHVRDEETEYVGGDDDDEAASIAFVRSLLDGDIIIGEPQQGVEGLGEGLGEGGRTYAVVQALAESANGGYVFVTGRVFTALGVQHARTVHCELGGHLNWTRSQLATTAFADLGVDPEAAVPGCEADALEIAYFPADGALGDVTGTLRFRNVGSVVCNLPGYPLVYLAGPDGTATVGPAATPDADDAPVHLGIMPGAAGFAFLTLSSPAGCASESFDALIVTPPSDSSGTPARRIVADGIEACPNGDISQLVVGGVHP